MNGHAGIFIVIIIMNTDAYSKKPLAFTIDDTEKGGRGWVGEVWGVGGGGGHRCKYAKHIHEN